MQIIELYEKLNFKFGSCTIEYKKNAKGDYKKHPNYNVEKDGKKSYNWKDPIYNEKYNGLYIVTGEDSGIVVVDLDNMEKEENKEIYSEGIKSSNMIIKTRKGYHIYYRYTDEYDRTIHCKSKEFDILSTGSHVYGAPTHYVDENNNKIEYKVDIIPKDKLNNMSKKMKDLINSYLMEPLESHNNATKKVINKELRETDKQISFESVTSREIVLNILDNIDEQRADDFRYWIMIGYALKNGGYGIVCENLVNNRMIDVVNVYSVDDEDLRLVGICVRIYYIDVVSDIRELCSKRMSMDMSVLPYRYYVFD